LKNLELETPAFIYDESVIENNLSFLKTVKGLDGCEVLYSIKPLAESTVLKVINKHVNGLSTSSLFEARLACEITGDRKRVHIVTPGLKANEIVEISKYAKHIVFNSVNQATELMKILDDAGADYSAGIRVNPQLSFVKDSRYDPCCHASKLGVPSITLPVHNLKGISGLHFHNNCDSDNPQQVLETTEKLIEELGDWIKTLEWVNMGGGYHFHEMKDHNDYLIAIKKLRDLGIKVIIEPGSTVVGGAGTLVSTVIDVFKTDGVNVAVLDTSVNHLPEALEFNIRQEVSESIEGGKYGYVLTGATCLAGDSFGGYEFNEELKVGSRVTFQSVGAYSMSKAQMFNGINLPNIYSKVDGELVFRRKFDYEHYKERWM